MKLASTLKRATGTSNAANSKPVVPEAKTSNSKTEACHSKGDSCLKKIQEKAYDLYLKRNGGPGSAEQDWAEAERIVKGS